MSPSGTALKRLGLVLFSVGVLLAFFLTALLVWADVEAFSYGFPRTGKEQMGGLSCPQFMGRKESADVAVTLRNGTERALRPRVQIMVSQSGLSLWRTTDTLTVEMQPGESKTNTWEVSASDIVLGQFVFARAYTFGSYPQPDQEGTCGIFVMDILGLGGIALFWLWLALSLGLIAAGLWLADFRRSELVQSPGKGLARKVLAVLVGIGLLAGYMGWWAVGVFLLIVLLIAFPAVLLYGQNR